MHRVRRLLTCDTEQETTARPRASQTSVRDFACPYTHAHRLAGARPSAVRPPRVGHTTVGALWPRTSHTWSRMLAHIAPLELYAHVPIVALSHRACCVRTSAKRETDRGACSIRIRRAPSIEPPRTCGLWVFVRTCCTEVPALGA